MHVIMGPIYIGGNSGVGAGGPVEPWAWAFGFVYDDNGDVIRDGGGSAIQIQAGAELLSTDHTGSELRSRVEADLTAQLPSFGITQTPAAYYWTDRDIA